MKRELGELDVGMGLLLGLVIGTFVGIVITVVRFA